MPVHQSGDGHEQSKRQGQRVSNDSRRTSAAESRGKPTDTKQSRTMLKAKDATTRSVTTSKRIVSSGKKPTDRRVSKQTSPERGVRETNGLDNKADVRNDEREENIIITQNADSNSNGSNTHLNEIENQNERPLSAEHKRELTPPPKSPSPPPEPEKFTLDKFNNAMDNFADVFSSQKFTHVHDDYPVDELFSVVSDVTESIEEFKQQTVSSQRHLEELRGKMRDVKERIQSNIQKKSNVLRVNDDTQTIHERELTEKLTRLNAQVAQANAELAEALRLSAETESSAVEAQLAAERAKEEAKNIQEEIELREKVDERRRIQEKKRMEEERQKQEEQRLREEEARLEKEAEWRRKENGAEKQTQKYEKWPTFEYKVKGEAIDLGCIVRGHPSHFNQNSITVKAIDQLDCPVTFIDNEELISAILDITPTSGDSSRLEESIVVCIPYKVPRQSHGHTSRESMVKVERDGQWCCVDTREETLDNYKEYKFAVAEISHLTKMAVFSRLKRDYATVSSRGGKVTSSYDQRISMSLPKNCINGNDHMIMEVQPVDSSSVSDLKHRQQTCKGLLTSSPIVHMEWESTEFKKPITVTVPCPPNPIKAKKIAQLRKEKEEKMKHPHKVVLILPHEQEALEKEKAKSKLQKLQEQIADDENKVEEPKPTKWYMGDYASVEDDENDNLFLVSSQGHNKWTRVDSVNIMQVKLDLLQFDLDKPLDKFMVIRTRTNVPEDAIGTMASEVSSYLSQKFVQVILKQKSDDPFDTVLSVIPSSKTEKTLKKLSEEGYDDGPEPSQVLSINEGDVIEVGFRGNVKNKDQEDIQFVYNSNLESETEFYACEVDKYLQKNFPVFRGVVEIYRKYTVKNIPKRKRRDSTDNNDEPAVETKRDLMCELAINIPKYHVEQNSTVIKAPVTIKNTSDPVNENLMRFVAEELGDEWRTVAGHLNISKPRLQAILRSIQTDDLTDCDVRYEMLMTWLKKMPKATDKIACLSNALLKSGRGDIAEDIRARDRDFREHMRAH